MSQVVEILIATDSDQPTRSLDCARAIPGVGLEGDRYANGKGAFSRQPQRPDGELTLIQKEHIDDFVVATGVTFSAQDARRNIVTNGVDLNALVGRDFRIGDVLIRGLRLCEPCNYLAKQTSPEILRGLVHKGGLRAQILTEGEIRVGDRLVEV
jgi:MOSC domain-containing protein YiiM